MNSIQRLKRAARISFETLVDAIVRRFGVYGYPPASPEAMRCPRVKSA